MKNFKNYLTTGLLATTTLFTACKKDDEAPPPENTPEVITDVTLVFTNDADDTDKVEAAAKDSDGAGAGKLEVEDEITLKPSTTYTLTFEISNALDPDDVEDIGEEISEEDNEHQFFFSFTDGAFTSPAGDGNVDTASDPLNYEDDKDENGNNVGLETQWTTRSDPLADGKFRVILKHQPGVKTGTSGSNDGDTDIDLTFVLNIES